jgi:hypothetical protein
MSTPEKRRDADAEADILPTQEIGRIYEWNGKPLQPFSVGRHCALQRLKVVGGSVLESAATLVRLCELSPAEVSAIRGDECDRFLSDLEAWMDANGVGLGAARKEKTEKLVALYDQIIGDLYDAESITTEKTGTSPPGNASRPGNRRSTHAPSPGPRKAV